MKKSIAVLLLITLALTISGCEVEKSGLTVTTPEGIEPLSESNSESSEEEELNDKIAELKKEIDELQAKLDESPSQSSAQESYSGLDNFVAEARGICGLDLTWEYGNGILRIKGNGDMEDYNRGDEIYTPWHDIEDNIYHIYIENGCTYIGRDAFMYLPHVSKVVLPDTLKIIGEGAIGRGAFYHCRSLQSINIPDGLEYIGGHAFDKCDSLKAITLPDNILGVGIDFVNDDTQVTWRGNVYTGANRGTIDYSNPENSSPPSELITRMSEAGVEVPPPAEFWPDVVDEG